MSLRIYDSNPFICIFSPTSFLRASDGGDNTGLSRVSVKVRAPARGGEGGGNRHKPEVVGPAQKSTVLESDEVGHLVAVVAAEDADGDREAIQCKNVGFKSLIMLTFPNLAESTNIHLGGCNSI